MLEIRNLSKSYGKKVALNNINLKFDNGLYGLLGPNGAGKSTLMNIITDNLKADNGEILWNGMDYQKNGMDREPPPGVLTTVKNCYTHCI